MGRQRELHLYPRRSAQERSDELQRGVFMGWFGGQLQLGRGTTAVNMRLRRPALV